MPGILSCVARRRRSRRPPLVLSFSAVSETARSGLQLLVGVLDVGPTVLLRSGRHGRARSFALRLQLPHSAAAPRWRQPGSLAIQMPGRRLVAARPRSTGAGLLPRGRGSGLGKGVGSRRASFGVPLRRFGPDSTAALILCVRFRQSLVGPWDRDDPLVLSAPYRDATPVSTSSPALSHGQLSPPAGGSAGRSPLGRRLVVEVGIEVAGPPRRRDEVASPLFRDGAGDPGTSPVGMVPPGCRGKRRISSISGIGRRLLARRGARRRRASRDPVTTVLGCGASPRSGLDYRVALLPSTATAVESGRDAFPRA